MNILIINMITGMMELTMMAMDMLMKAQKFVSYRGWRRRARDFGDDVDARRCDAGLPRVFSVGRWGLAEVYGRTNCDLIIKRE